MWRRPAWIDNISKDDNGTFLIFHLIHTHTHTFRMRKCWDILMCCCSTHRAWIDTKTFWHRFGQGAVRMQKINSEAVIKYKRSQLWQTAYLMERLWCQIQFDFFLFSKNCWGAFFEWNTSEYSKRNFQIQLKKTSNRISSKSNSHLHLRVIINRKNSHWKWQYQRR